MSIEFYPLGDTPKMGELWWLGTKSPQNIMAIKTGEMRSPKADEWFLSGAIPRAYKAMSDVSTPYYILKLVRVKVKTIYEIVE